MLPHHQSGTVVQRHIERVLCRVRHLRTGTGYVIITFILIAYRMFQIHRIQSACPGFILIHAGTNHHRTSDRKAAGVQLTDISFDPVSSGLHNRHVGLCIPVIVITILRNRLNDTVHFRSYFGFLHGLLQSVNLDFLRADVVLGLTDIGLQGLNFDGIAELVGGSRLLALLLQRGNLALRRLDAVAHLLQLQLALFDIQRSFFHIIRKENLSHSYLVAFLYEDFLYRLLVIFLNFLCRQRDNFAGIAVLNPGAQTGQHGYGLHGNGLTGICAPGAPSHD